MIYGVAPVAPGTWVSHDVEPGLISRVGVVIYATHENAEVFFGQFDQDLNPIIATIPMRALQRYHGPYQHIDPLVAEIHPRAYIPDIALDDAEPLRRQVVPK
jgi:hypothetical protein